jgi:poly [ADP-ribose] polymerase 2/3/4
MGSVTKLTGPDTGEYSETVKWCVLSCGNIEVNSNKFYVIEIQKSVSTASAYRIFTHYGRINQSNVYEMRGPYSSLASAESDYNKIIRAKQRGKTGGASKYEIVDVIAPTVGSNNIRGKAQSIKVGGADSIVFSDNDRFSVDVMRVLNQLAEENIHKLTSVTSMTFTSRGIETALGPVTDSHVRKARQELEGIQRIVRATGDKATKEFQLANNRYLSLIPHTFGRKITESDWISDDKKLVEEFDLLDQLEAAVRLGLTADRSADKFKGFQTELKEIDANPFRRMVDDTKAHNHLRGWKVADAYEVHIPTERARFEKAKDGYGNLMDFFHGSMTCNYLSILLNGLIIPSHGEGMRIAGRLFGNGIYGARSSTKSMNYSTGSWVGGANKYSNIFLLRIKFAMGRVYEAIGNYLGRGKNFQLPAGYHSTAVYPRNTDLQNEEFIVYSLEQCTITHLLELEQR